MFPNIFTMPLVLTSKQLERKQTCGRLQLWVSIVLTLFQQHGMKEWLLLCDINFTISDNVHERVVQCRFRPDVVWFAVK